MAWIGRLIFGGKQAEEEEEEDQSENQEEEEEEEEQSVQQDYKHNQNSNTMSRSQQQNLEDLGDNMDWDQEIYPPQNEFDIPEEDEDEEEDEPEYEPPKSATRRSVPAAAASSGRATIRRSSGRKSAGSRMNDSLAAGIVHNRTYVGRGSEIGVFRHNENGSLEYLTRIPTIKTMKGETFTPSKMLLHSADDRMLMLNSSDPSRVYEMDIERGKIINEFNAKEGLSIRSIGGVSKYAEATPESTVLGVSDSAVFTMDPRLAGAHKIAREHQYKTNNKMSSISSTGAGKVAVGSDKGEIRLFNDIGKNAKTCLAGYGDPIIGMDVTEDGRWVAATCKNYILLVDTVPNEGAKSGFDQSITKSTNEPIKLQLHPNDIAKYNIDTVAFTPAKFNIGENINEEWLVNSTGKYLIIWNFKRIKADPSKYLYDYKIKLCTEDVVADQFLYGQDRQVVVTLPDQVFLQTRR